MNKLRKVTIRLSIIFCFITLLPVVSYADVRDGSKNKGSFSGFYLGAGFGVTGMKTSRNNSSSFGLTSLGPVTSTSSSSVVGSNVSLLGELELGYAALLSHNFNFGVSAFLDVASLKTSNYLNMTKVGGATFQDLKSSSTALSNLIWGIRAEPGLMLGPNTLFMGIVGWELAKENITAEHHASLSSNSTGNTSSQSRNSINGLTLGLGFLEQVTPSVALGVRYTYTNFFKGNSLNTPVANTTGAGIHGPFSSSVGASNIDTQAVSVNLRYYLGGTDGVYSNRAKFNPHTFNGYYVTGRLGSMISDTSSENANISGSYRDRGGFINQPSLLASQPGYPDSPMGTVGFGIGRIFSKVAYLGLEGSVDWSKKKVDSNLSQGFRPITVSGAGQAPDVISQNLKLSVSNVEPAIDFKAGIVLPYNFMPYFRTGVSFSKLELSIVDQLVYTNNNAIIQTINLSANDSSSYKARLRLGVGAEYQYSYKSSFSLNYIYTYYGSLNINRTQTTIDGAGRSVTLSDHTKMRLKNHVLSIGYTYYVG